MDDAKIVETAMTFGDVFDKYVIEEIAHKLNCTEANALVDLLTAVNRHETAERLLELHSADDDEEERANH